LGGIWKLFISVRFLASLSINFFPLLFFFFSVGEFESFTVSLFSSSALSPSSLSSAPSTSSLPVSSSSPEDSSEINKT
jgi:hypothetical protein